MVNSSEEVAGFVAIARTATLFLWEFRKILRSSPFKLPPAGTTIQASGLSISSVGIPGFKNDTE